MIAIDFKDFHLYKSQVDTVLVAKTLDEVKPLLQQVEALWREGFYAVGYVSYEAGRAFDPKLEVKKENKLPLAWFAVFAEPEHQINREAGSYQVGEWLPDSSRESYQQAIKAIHDAIARGDTYQVNHSIRMHADFDGDAWAYYQQLSGVQSGYNAYLDIGDFQILSVSPELFFRWEQDRLITRPMKGTAKRGRYQEEDILCANKLLESEKDRAENLMIVDLLRNDLGKIAVPGSVCVPELFTVERYSTLWTMTSTIQADTLPATTLTDIFTALFPCGSITGAPKRKTMELISSFEQSPREVYCGTIGYLKPSGEAVFNVGIRTVIIDQQSGKATYGVGGWITWDSTSGVEYE